MPCRNNHNKIYAPLAMKTKYIAKRASSYPIKRIEKSVNFRVNKRNSKLSTLIAGNSLLHRRIQL